MRIDPSGEHTATGPVVAPADGALSELDLEILAFEGRFWRYQATKEAAIRARFGVSPARHYQRVLTLLDRPEAVAHAPATVARLRRLMHRRRGDARPRGL